MRQKVSPIDVLIIKFEVIANTKSRIYIQILDSRVGDFTYWINADIVKAS